MTNKTTSGRRAIGQRQALFQGVCVVFLLLLLAACGGTDTGVSNTTGATPQTAVTPTSAVTPTPTTAATGSGQDITITGGAGSYAFSPDTLTIPVGTTVTWTNTTKAPHTVTSDDGKSFDSGTDKPIDPGATFSFKFTQPGTYAYHCRFHASMVAKIIVK